MYGYFRDRYCAGTLTDAQLTSAVRLKMITAAQAAEIPGECERLAAEAAGAASQNDTAPQEESA